ncbi:hypothetical protein WR25_24377 isoform H [Diploscapter pachys]|uniref:Purple acid phosphatase n=1 Tax=Diploscapter pachys TaxID=2018661 RepID=A0A2A2LRZ7_9BILA|nr:hypothetical protein WR25_24377 isoform H [Diploscapter pachys]
MGLFWHSCILLAIFLQVAIAASVPEQVHLAFHGDTSEMAVIWTTFYDGLHHVYYGTDVKNMNQVAIETSIKKWTSGSVTRYSHRAKMSNLKPSTTYYYKIEGRVFEFKTLSANPQSYRVCIFGDLGYEHGNSTDAIIRNGLNGQFDFIIHVGDIAYDLHTDDGRRGDAYMRRFEPLFSAIPYMVIAGNHENDGKNFSNFQERFWMPHNGFNDNHFYSFDLGPVHWVGLSSEFYGYDREYGKESIWTQYNWLNTDLKAAVSKRKSVPWIITYQHRPIYCSIDYNHDCSEFENTFLRSGALGLPGLEPSYIQSHVDLNFCGHQHAYERFYPVADRKYYTGKDVYHNAPAPTYILTGSAGCHTPAAKFSSEPLDWSAFRLVRVISFRKVNSSYYLEATIMAIPCCTSLMLHIFTCSSSLLISMKNRPMISGSAKIQITWMQP